MVIFTNNIHPVPPPLTSAAADRFASADLFKGEPGPRHHSAPRDSQVLTDLQILEPGQIKTLVQRRIVSL